MLITRGLGTSTSSGGIGQVVTNLDGVVVDTNIIEGSVDLGEFGVSISTNESRGIIEVAGISGTITHVDIDGGVNGEW